MSQYFICSESRGDFRSALWPKLLASFATVLLCIDGAILSAGELPAQQRDLFENHVRPTLVSQCMKCHGDTKQEGGLRLPSLESLLKGGESGPAIVPEKPDESLLIEALRYGSFEVPPTGRLAEQVVDGIAAWIEAGLSWPRGLVLKPTPKITERDRDWWCYQPIADPAVPDVDDNGWCRNEIDRFVFDRLKREGLAPSKEADASKLARRVHFAVTGFGALALAGLLPQRQAESSERPAPALLSSKMVNQARAKSVIFLFMDGGPSHLDTFDPKSAFDRLAGKPILESFGRVITAMGEFDSPILPSARNWKQHGEGGLWISDWLPHTAQMDPYAWPERTPPPAIHIVKPVGLWSRPSPFSLIGVRGNSPPQTTSVWSSSPRCFKS